MKPENKPFDSGNHTNNCWNTTCYYCGLVSMVGYS